VKCIKLPKYVGYISKLRSLIKAMDGKERIKLTQDTMEWLVFKYHKNHHALRNWE
jgi:hypothetical protein